MKSNRSLNEVALEIVKALGIIKSILSSINATVIERCLGARDSQGHNLANVASSL